jgi:Pyridoxamine 5'-phosphate oxidase
MCPAHDDQQHRLYNFAVLDAVQATVVGTALKLGPKERPDAARLMFARHPGMKIWAKLAHKWSFFELDVNHVVRNR